MDILEALRLAREQRQRRDADLLKSTGCQIISGGVVVKEWPGMSEDEPEPRIWGDYA